MQNTRTFSDDEIKHIIQRYIDGGTVCSVAKDAHCRTTYISEILRNNGITPRQGCTNSRHLNKHYFDIIDDNMKAYFVGLLFTDGSIIASDKERSPAISIELVEQDNSILNTMKKVLDTGNKLSRNERPGRTVTNTLSVRSKELSEALSKYGIVPGKTYVTEHLPHIPEEYIRSFLHGLIDGDGSVYWSLGSWHINFCSHFKSICEDFQALCNDVTNRDMPLSIQESNGVYRVTYNGKWAKALGIECFFGEEGIPRKRRLVERMILGMDEDIVHSTVKAVV